MAHELFQGLVPTTVDFGIFLAFGLMAGVIMADLQNSLLGFFAAMWIGTILLYVLATLPALTGVVQPPGDQAVYTIWIVLIFRAVFPVPFAISLVSSLIGAALGETYL